VIAKNQDTSHSLDQSHFLQFVADNVNHNTDTIDGNNTFHGKSWSSCLNNGLSYGINFQIRVLFSEYIAEEKRNLLLTE
jgi:hypothetical protein